MMIGRLHSFWDGNFSGANSLLNFQGVKPWIIRASLEGFPYFFTTTFEGIHQQLRELRQLPTEQDASHDVFLVSAWDTHLKKSLPGENI